MSRKLRWVSLLLFVGCASAPSPPATTAHPAGKEPTTLSNDVHWTRGSAEHRALFEQTFRLAARRVEVLAEGRPAGTWAVAIDADESLLDNSQYQKELLERGESYSRESWSEWVHRRASPALPGARRFLDRVRELGGRIAVVTNRLEEYCPATRATLEAAGLAFDVVLCRPGEDRDKAPRWAQVEAGTALAGLPAAEVLLWVGDNVEDFPGAGQELRSAPDEALAAFGDRFFVLPNPMYGSWVANPPS